MHLTTPALLHFLIFFHYGQPLGRLDAQEDIHLEKIFLLDKRLKARQPAAGLVF